MRCTSLQGTISVGDGHAGVIVEVRFNVATNDATEGTDEVVNLSGVCASNGVSNAYTVHADLVDGLVYGKQVHEVGTEGIFRGEADFHALGLDKGNDLDGSLSNVCHVLAVREFAQERRCANHDIDTIDAYGWEMSQI